MKTSPALARWQAAHFSARAARANIDMLGVGAHRDLVMLYRPDLDKWIAERDRLYAALTPGEKIIADRIAKETA